MFLSNLKVLKCNMQNLEQKVEKYTWSHLLVIKGNWFSGAAGAAQSWLSYWTSVHS